MAHPTWSKVGLFKCDKCGYAVKSTVTYEKKTKYLTDL